MLEEKVKETKARRVFEKLLDSVGSEDQEVLDRLVFDFAGRAMTRLHELGGPFLHDDYSAAIHARYDWARGVGPWGSVPLWGKAIHEQTEAAFQRAASSFSPERKKLLMAEYHTRSAVLSSMNRNPYDGIKGMLRHLSLMTQPAKEVWDQATQDLQEALDEKHDVEHFAPIKKDLEDKLFENNPTSSLESAIQDFNKWVEEFAGGDGKILHSLAILAARSVVEKPNVLFWAEQLILRRIIQLKKDWTDGKLHPDRIRDEHQFFRETVDSRVDYLQKKPRLREWERQEIYGRTTVIKAMVAVLDFDPITAATGTVQSLADCTVPPESAYLWATQILRQEHDRIFSLQAEYSAALFQNNPSSSLSLAQAEFLSSLVSQEGYRENPPQPKTLERPTALFQHLGAKNQLWPEIVKVLLRIGTDRIAEPFAGSAVVSRNYGAKKVYLAEQNSEIREILIRLRDGDIEQLFRQMLLFEVDLEDRTEIYPEGMRAAQGLHRRIFHDPIRGAWKLVTDKGLLAKKKVMEEAQRAFQGAEFYDDALDLIEDYSADKGITWFLDPPYPEACHVGYGEHGKCYDMNDYKALLNATAKIRGPVIITGYENMRPPKRLRFKEVAVEVVNRLARKGTKQIEYIWWREG